MKLTTKLAAAAIALTFTTGSAFAFNSHHGFGGTAKYFANNMSGSTGTVKAGNRYGGCGCGEGFMNVTNSSEQYNSSYKSTGHRYMEVGGEAGSINNISTNWKNIPSVRVHSNSSAFGASGITNRRY